MKLRIPLTLLAAAALAFGVHLLRSSQKVAIIDGVPSSETVPVEEQMRDSIIPPPVAEKTEATDPIKEPQFAPKIQLSRGKLGWEAAIESVTNAPGLDDAAKSRQLLAMIATFPENGLTSASEEAVKRLPDADYNAVALPMVINPQTHGLVESVLFADLMERPDAITLPALLRIAKTSNHPYAKFAHDNLDLLVGEDFGADWLKWEAAVQKTLAAEK